MSTFIGPRPNKTGLLHITKGKREQAQLRDNVYNDTVFHTDLPYLRIYKQYYVHAATRTWPAEAKSLVSQGYLYSINQITSTGIKSYYSNVMKSPFPHVTLKVDNRRRNSNGTIYASGIWFEPQAAFTGSPYTAWPKYNYFSMDNREQGVNMSYHHSGSLIGPYVNRTTTVTKNLDGTPLPSHVDVNITIYNMKRNADGTVTIIQPGMPSAGILIDRNDLKIGDFSLKYNGAFVDLQSQKIAHHPNGQYIQRQLNSNDKWRIPIPYVNPLGHEGMSTSAGSVLNGAQQPYIKLGKIGYSSYMQTLDIAKQFPDATLEFSNDTLQLRNGPERYQIANPTMTPTSMLATPLKLVAPVNNTTRDALKGTWHVTKKVVPKAGGGTVAQSFWHRKELLSEVTLNTSPGVMPVMIAPFKLENQFAMNVAGQGNVRWYYNSPFYNNLLVYPLSEEYSRTEGGSIVIPGQDLITREPETGDYYKQYSFEIYIQPTADGSVLYRVSWDRQNSQDPHIYIGYTNPFNSNNELQVGSWVYKFGHLVRDRDGERTYGIYREKTDKLPPVTEITLGEEIGPVCVGSLRTESGYGNVTDMGIVNPSGPSHDTQYFSRVDTCWLMRLEKNKLRLYREDFIEDFNYRFTGRGSTRTNDQRMTGNFNIYTPRLEMNVYPLLK